MSTRRQLLRTVGFIAGAILMIGAAGGPATADKLNAQAGLAIKGYDPVAYLADGRAVQGSPQFTYKWNGVEWRFTSAAHRDQFAAAPEKYTPQFGGFCAYAASKGYVADTDPTAFTVVDGRLYLNFSHQVMGTWRQDIPGNVAKANGHWPRLSQQ